MNRRTFIRRAIGAFAAAPLAPYVPKIAARMRPPMVTLGSLLDRGTVVVGINRATYPFWRNQQTTGPVPAQSFDAWREAMRTVYREAK